MASPQLAVYTLALTDPLWVRAYVQGPDMGKIHPGMRAVVTTDSYPGKRYRAWLGYISPSAEFTPKSVETTDVRSKLVYQVRIFVCNSQNELRLGMPATVTIALDQAQSSRRSNVTLPDPLMPPMAAAHQTSLHSPASPGDDTALQVDQLSKAFRSDGRLVQALNNVSFRVRHGRVTGLIGPDSAGKTTLMRLAAGLAGPR